MTPPPSSHTVDPARPLPGAGGGPLAFAVLDARGAPTDLMAVQVARGVPPRARALVEAAGLTEGVLGPVGHGPGPAPGGMGAEAYYVFCPTPPGPPVGAASRSWSEVELLECLLRPAVQALARLEARGVTHRGIRADNVFQAAPGAPVVLGQAWSTPPAALQPALFEPPYSAMCLPCGRGEGGSADDVYALGALMLVLAMGMAADVGDAAGTVRRKLDLGSFGAIVGDARVPPMIADLARGMLAEDPDHRPPLSLLLDPHAARARRLAARPPRRAPAPIRIGPWSAVDARTLAHTLAAHPEPGLAALKSGAVDAWLRRDLGDAVLAGRIDDLVRARPLSERAETADAMLAMRALAALDPLAPLCWRGIALWPDGIGPALAAAQRLDETHTAEAVIDLVTAEAPAAWATARPGRADPADFRAEARRAWAMLTGKGPLPSPVRLAYALNPLLACDSPLLGTRAVARLGDLLPALEAQPQQGGPPIDADIAAFVAARAEGSAEAETALRAIGDTPGAALARIELFAALQDRGRAPVPALARWLVANPDLLLAGWRNNAVRSRLAGRLDILAGAGHLRPLLALVRDPDGRAADLRGAREAAAQLAWIETELARIECGAPAREASARHLGQEAAAGIAFGALALSLALALFG